LKGKEVIWKDKEFGKKGPRSITVAKMQDLLKQVPLLQSQEARDFITSLIENSNQDVTDDVDCADELDESDIEELFED
jgi:hypothetical protein